MEEKKSLEGAEDGESLGINESSCKVPEVPACTLADRMKDKTWLQKEWKKPPAPRPARSGRDWFAQPKKKQSKPQQQKSTYALLITED